MAQYTEPLVSIIVPVYNVEELVPKCLDSLLMQTYRNIEIIVVNDGSDGNINAIVTEYQKRVDTIKLIDLGANHGLFRARLEGFKAAGGDYIATVDGDDSISVDYIRTMIARADENKSDIVMAETVIEKGNEKYIFNQAADLPFDYLEGKECLGRFFEQRGENYNWHTVHSKIYSRRILLAAIPFLDGVKEHIVMCEDILFSTVLWRFAKRIDRAPTAHYYYYMREGSSTVTNSVESLTGRIKNITTVFATVAQFLKSENVYADLKRDLKEWANQYSLMYHHHIRGLALDSDTKDRLLELIVFGDEDWDKKTESQFYEVKTVFNDGLENAKQGIIDEDIEYVSFDIFDTLVTRPFLTPSDLFYLMEHDFREIDRNFRLESFRNIRVKSEELARLEKSDKEDVTLEQVYRVMHEEYYVDKNVAREMLKKELDYETRYCSQRKTTKDLYDLAKYLGKNIIITSDIYLPKETIENILQRCGYEGYDKLYVSSYHGTMKATQNLYRHIASDLAISPEHILHIGDNHDSDVVAAKKAGWRALHLPKCVEAVPDIFGGMFGDSVSYAQGHLGITSAFAVMMNKYFDNPFRSFSRESNYNCSPYLLGYFSLGLSLLGFTKWMIEDMKVKNIESVVFLSRDGHLPMQAFGLFQRYLKLPVQSNYLPTSRKATIPLTLFGEANLAEIKTFNYRNQITDSILASLKVIQKDPSSNSLDTIDFAKAKQLQELFVNTYKGFFKGKVAVMDIGYSGRPEQTFAKLFDKPIETYFMYTDKDEAKRRLGQTVNVYGRLNAAGLREKMISELAPSCIGYEKTGTKVKPVYGTNANMSYHETYVLSQMQRGALDFIHDYLANFSKHLDVLDFGDNQLTMEPLDQATMKPTVIDKEMFRGIIQEDDIAGDNAFDVFDQYYDAESKDVHLHHQNSQLMAELESHMGIKRSAKLLAGNIKRRIKYGKNR